MIIGIISYSDSRNVFDPYLCEGRDGGVHGNRDVKIELSRTDTLNKSSGTFTRYN